MRDSGVGAFLSEDEIEETSCGEAKDHVEQLSKKKQKLQTQETVVSVITLVATAPVCLHDVSLM